MYVIKTNDPNKVLDELRTHFRNQRDALEHRIKNMEANKKTLKIDLAKERARLHIYKLETDFLENIQVVDPATKLVAEGEI